MVADYVRLRNPEGPEVPRRSRRQMKLSGHAMQLAEHAAQARERRVGDDIRMRAGRDVTVQVGQDLPAAIVDA
jgi:hypothetical protein